MVRIAPFRAYRHESKRKSNNVSSFICPPYDVISDEGRRALVRKYPTNVVQLELPSGKGREKYIKAGTLLQRWVKLGVLSQDERPSFYLLETTFKVDDPFAPKKKLKRYGVLGALGLETPGKGKVRPHEKTLPKAKEDRLNLLRSVQTTISPIFGMFLDQRKEWAKWVAKATKKKPTATGQESAQLSHRLWKIEDPSLQGRLQNLLRKKELYIADGHHRYEVSWAYKESRLRRDAKPNRGAGWNYIMTYICPMDNPGLLMLPTHRLVKSKKTIPQWEEHLSTFFDMKPIKNRETLVSLLAKAKKTDRVLGWVNAKGIYLLKLKPSISLARCLSHRPKALRALNVVLLHDLALEEAAGAKYIKGETIFFAQDIKAMQQKAKKDPKWVGFILGSAGVDSLAQVASAGEVMPPKTTYFYPKVPTGFTLMPLDQKIG